MTLEEIAVAQSAYQDSVLLAFEQHLRELLERVAVRSAESIRQRLKIDKSGHIQQSTASYGAIRRFSTTYQQELDAAGYSQLIEAFVQQFPGQNVFLQDILDLMNERLKFAKPIHVGFSAKSSEILSGFQLGAVGSIEDAVESAGATVQQRTMFSVGGLEFVKLAEVISESAGIAMERAKRIAETAMVIYSRKANDLQFQEIEKGLPIDSTKYKYFGPLDLKTRPFCIKVLAEGVFSRPEIDALDNGQLPNCMVTAGGFRCRHQWALWEIAGVKIA